MAITMQMLYLLLLLLGSSSRVAVSRSTVASLPGFPGSLPFDLETGYVGVDEENDRNLFYYFVKSERNPKEDPLVLWLTGGPGCSTISALAYEIGPLYFKGGDYNGGLPTLVLNPNSWTKIANIIFLDEPVGTGFSYSRTVQGAKTSDTKSARDSYTFLRKWLNDHPEFLSNPLYVCGDSYSGITIPMIVQHLINDIEAGKKPIPNFKGYTIGNPVTDTILEKNARIPFAHGMGLISNELYESMKQNCKGKYLNFDLSNAMCSKDREAFEMCTSRLNDGQILEPKCPFASPKPKKIDRYRRSLANSSESFISQPLFQARCRRYGYLLSYRWANDVRVRKALGIRKGTVEGWIRCNYDDLPYEYDVETSMGYHQNLSTRGYPCLIYSGDHDMVVSFISTQAWIRLLNLSIVDDWRPWLVDGQIAGYTRNYSNGMTYATVKGGGHIAPEYKPKESFAMFKRWISHNPL